MKTASTQPPSDNPQGEILIYRSEDGRARIEVRFVDETVWLTQAQLVELFQSSKANISEHIKNIFDEGELDEESVVRKFRTTAADGKSYNVTHYNLDLIISLGYRVKSSIATQFRRWATDKALAEYRKFQVKALSPVEEAYLQTIKTVSRVAERKRSRKQ